VVAVPADIIYCGTPFVLGVTATKLVRILARLGIVIVMLAIFCFVATEVFRRRPELHLHKKAIAGALAGGGALLWLIGKVHGKGEDGTSKNGGPVALRFCGGVLAGAGAIVSCVIPISQAIASPQTFAQVIVQKHLSSILKKPGAGHSGTTETAKGPLKVQGIFFRTNDPSAIINGQTVFVGDRIGAARITAIERQSVTVEIAQEKKVLSFRL
jgi:uncharacterized membrane protein YjfL (UPF0719 family)